MSNIKQFFREVDKKATHKKETHGWLIMPISLFLAFFTTIYFTKNAIFVSPFEFALLEGLLIATFSLMFYIMGNFGLLLWAFSEQSYPPVQGKFANIKRVVKIIINIPNANQLLKALRLLNDVLDKNGFEDYLSATQFMKNVYDRLDMQDKKIEEQNKLIKQLLSEQAKTETNSKDAQPIQKDHRFESI